MPPPQSALHVTPLHTNHLNGALSPVCLTYTGHQGSSWSHAGLVGKNYGHVVIMQPSRVMGSQGTRKVMIIDFGLARIVPGLTNQHPDAKAEAAELAEDLRWQKSEVMI